MGWKNDVDSTGWNWIKQPYREDPFTGRKICRACWNGEHSTIENPQAGYKACDNSGCNCGCRQSLQEQATERKRKSLASKERRKNLRAQLEDESNPLRAVNDAYREKTNSRRVGS